MLTPLILLPGEPEPKPVVTGKIKITRSFSYKLNIGDYQSVDFFCSQNSFCDAARAEEVSEAVYQFCKAQVLKALAEYKAERKAQEDTYRREINERKADMQRTKLAPFGRVDQPGAHA